jgi:fructose-1,6-bisphosphatase II / sedoheptulose-1,7-bisphosphatase
MANNDFDRTLVLEAVRVTEAAATAAWHLIGRGHEKDADQVAVDAMRTALNNLDVNGRIVIGEGERDEAPMLYIGEEVGTGKGVKLDIALDPLEGTTLTAKAMSNALAVMAWAPRGTMLHAPDTYMDKIACGPGLPKGVIDLDASPADNVKSLATALKRKTSEVTVCVLDRPRHAAIIEELRSVDARIYLITDGDVAGVIHTTDPQTGIDLYIGQGGAPEGVLACSALKCVGGQFQGRLVFRNADEKSRATRLGIKDLDRKYELDDIIQNEAIFAATGVTKGAMLDGVRHIDGFVHTHSLVMASWSCTIREVRMKKRLPC